MLYNICHVRLYNICHVMLYNKCHVMLYNICHVMLGPSRTRGQNYLFMSKICHHNAGQIETNFGKQ